MAGAMTWCAPPTLLFVYPPRATAEDPCEAGFDGVLSKPVRLPDLKDVLERYGMTVQA